MVLDAGNLRFITARVIKFENAQERTQLNFETDESWFCDRSIRRVIPFVCESCPAYLRARLTFMPIVSFSFYLNIHMLFFLFEPVQDVIEGRILLLWVLVLVLYKLKLT